MGEAGRRTSSNREERLVVNHVRQNEGCTHETRPSGVGAHGSFVGGTLRHTHTHTHGRSERRSRVSRARSPGRRCQSHSMLPFVERGGKTRGGGHTQCLLKWRERDVVEERVAAKESIPRTTPGKRGTEDGRLLGRKFLSNHRDSILCGPYDVDKRGTKRPPKNGRVHARRLCCMLVTW